MRAQIALWCDLHLAPEWRNVHKLYSVWVSLFWSGALGLWVAWPAFQGVVPWGVFVGVCVAFPIVLTIARLLKQPGLN